MQVQTVSFGYSSPLKTVWKQGRLPTVTRGIYGNILTKDNISLEHIIPHSLGGKTTIDNLMLAERTANMRRGTRPLMEVISFEQLFDYLQQFVGVKVKGFNGNDYIIKIMKRIGGLK